MYATIRRYAPKAGAVTKGALDDLKHRIEELVTISLFEDKDGATESTRRAADFVKTDPMKGQLGSPEVLEGELLLLKEAAVGAR